MANSLMQLVSDGNLSVVPLTIKFFEQSHIGVYIDDVALPTAGYSYVWSGATTITITPAVALGVEVSIRRRTPYNYVLHDFQAGAVFSETSIDENFRQDLFLLQEASEQSFVTDLYDNLNMHGSKVVNLGKATSPSDATPLSQVEQLVEDSGGSPYVRQNLAEVVRRSYAEVGYNVVGTFREGFTLVNANDIGIDEGTGKGFTGPAGAVGAGTDPTSGGFIDRSGDTLRSDLQASSSGKGASLITFIQSGITAIATTLRQKIRQFVTPEDYGGSSVTNSIITAMATASAMGVPLRCSPVDYPTNTSIIPQTGLEWYANGCRVVATTDASTSAVRILNDDVTIRGLLRINLSDPGGTPSAYRGHVLVGDWQDGAIKPRGFSFDRIFLEGGHANINGFAVAGGANNVRGKSIRCGNSNKIGRLFMAHWANFNSHFLSGGNYQHAVGATPTTHPHDIVIDEVSSGDITGSYGDFMALVAISAGYDISIPRIAGNIVNTGPGPANILLITAGDLGLAYATPQELAAGMFGLEFGVIRGDSNHALVNRIGRALYYNADSTPQPAKNYFVKIKANYGSVTGATTTTVSQPIGGSNGYGAETFGVADVEGGTFCCSIGLYSTDMSIDVLRCKNSILNALQIAGAGSDQSEWPQGITIGRLEIDGTASTGVVTQSNAIGFRLQSCKNVKIGEVRVNKTNTLGYVGVVSTAASRVSIGDTFINDANYDPTLTVAYSNSATFADQVSVGNVYGPIPITQPVSGGVTFRTLGRNKEYYAVSGFTNGTVVNNGDRVWITGSTGTALSQVKTSGTIGSTAVTKDQLTYT